MVNILLMLWSEVLPYRRKIKKVYLSYRYVLTLKNYSAVNRTHGFNMADNNEIGRCSTIDYCRNIDVQDIACLKRVFIFI